MEVLKKNSTLVLTVILALVAAIIIYFSVKAISPTTPVVVANQNLSVGTVISKEHLTTRNFPANNIPSTAFSFTKDIIGKTVTNGPVLQGDMIRSEHLSMDGSLMSTLKTYAPEGWTAIALPGGDEVGMKGLKRGDKVSVYGELLTAEGVMVTELVSNAIVLSLPSEKQPQQYIIAVPDNYTPVIAETKVHDKSITIALPSNTENVVEEITEIEEIEETEEAEE